MPSVVGSGSLEFKRGPGPGIQLWAMSPTRHLAASPSWPSLCPAGMVCWLRSHVCWQSHSVGTADLEAMYTFSSPSQSHPSEAPPAYTPQAAEGHYTVSYGTESGEFSSVGENFYRNHSQPPPLETLGLDADELILIPNGVQIFFVNPAGEVSAPSYPGYLRIVRFLDNSLDTVLNRPPGFLQVSQRKM